MAFNSKGYSGNVGWSRNTVHEETVAAAADVDVAGAVAGGVSQVQALHMMVYHLCSPEGQRVLGSGNDVRGGWSVFGLHWTRTVPHAVRVDHGGQVSFLFLAVVLLRFCEREDLCNDSNNRAQPAALAVHRLQ